MKEVTDTDRLGALGELLGWFLEQIRGLGSFQSFLGSMTVLGRTMGLDCGREATGFVIRFPATPGDAAMKS